MLIIWLEEGKRWAFSAGGPALAWRLHWRLAEWRQDINAEGLEAVSNTSDATERKMMEIELAWKRHRLTTMTHRGRERDPELTVKLKTKLAGQQNWRCFECGCCIGLAHHLRDSQPCDMKIATFEHLRPRIEGGTNSVSNLAITCNDCNTIYNSLWERRKDEFCSLGL